MHIERIIQIHLAVQTSLGAVLLAMGQRNPLMPLVVVFAAFSSLLFTDVLNWFRVNRIVGNVAAILALIVAVSGFRQPDTQRQLLAVADLLLYLQLVLFYQRKSTRLYWQLTMLSLLQVVVAAALDVGVEFGVLLVAYALVATSTLCFFFVHRESVHVATAAPVSRRWSRQAAGTRRGEWSPMLDRRPVCTAPVTAPVLARQMASRGLFGQTAVIGATTLVFTMVLFFSAPRLDSAARRESRRGARRFVELPTEITLNEAGLVMPSRVPVLRARFLDAVTRKPQRIVGELYLHGVVLTDYDCTGRVPRWRQPTWYREKLRGLLAVLAQDGGGLSPTRRLREPPAGQPLLRQEIVLEPTKQPVLFSVLPAYAAPDTPDDIRIHVHRGQLLRYLDRHEPPPIEYRYTLVTTGVRGGLQLDATPHASLHEAVLDRVVLDFEKMELTAFDSHRFPQLKATADEIVAKLSTQPPSRVAIARALETYFHAGNGFRYTLDFRTVWRTSNVDPIEDFVSNHRTGHCEYFASALALMLRSQGIPARLAVGYKGGEYNSVGGYYQVRQKDAHAWVEAYLEPDDAAAQVPPGADTSPAGGWLRLDPTPPTSRDQEGQLRKGLVKIMDDGLDYARTLWTDYILELTAQRQRQSIYDPVSDNADPEAWSAFLARLLREHGFLQDWLRRVTTGWWLLLLVPLLTVLLTVTVVRIASRQSVSPALANTVRRWRTRWTSQGAAEAARAAPRLVAFYHQFEALLARRGIRRRAGETPREFASHVGGPAGSQLTAGTLPRIAVLIVDAFYRVRYGQAELGTDELAAIGTALVALEGECAVREPATDPA
jgi:transglutaminase-like putative cysteine protease